MLTKLYDYPTKSDEFFAAKSDSTSMAPCYTGRMTMIVTEQVAHHDERITMIAGQIAALSRSLELLVRSLDNIDRQIAEVREHVKVLELMQPPATRQPWQFETDGLDNAA